MTNMLTFRSHAKINLYLDVLDRRPDGFHNIETIFQTVSLADELTVAEAPSGVVLTCSRPDLDCGPGNLVCRAAALLLARTGCVRGARIHLEKHIPVAAGLAGGSGNAAATLDALNRLWKLGLTPAQLQAFGLELGSDVPYCLVGGTQGATGRGEQLVPLPPVPQTWCVLAHPPIQVSTAAVYHSPRLFRNTETPSAGRTRTFQCALDALSAGDWARRVTGKKFDTGVRAAPRPRNPQMPPARGRMRCRRHERKRADRVRHLQLARAGGTRGRSSRAVCDKRRQNRGYCPACRVMRARGNPPGSGRNCS